MDEFFIDKLGENYDDESDNDDLITDNNSAFKSVLLDDLPDLDEDLDVNVKKKENRNKKKFSITDTYIVTSYKNKDIEPPSDVSDILKKSVIGPGFEKQNALPPPKNSKVAKLERKKQRERTKGEKWFNIPATEVTNEIKNDFQILKMRAVLDKKKVYKNKTITRMPKYFQVGRVLDSPADFYSGRIVKSQRKKTMVEELLADAECKNYQKRKFKEIMDTKRRKHVRRRNADSEKKGKKGKVKK